MREPRSADEPTEVESTDVDDRTQRVHTEYTNVLPEGVELFTVVGENHPERDQGAYTVDLRLGRCSCADSKYREPVGACKHVRRVEFATGPKPVPAGVSPGDVADEFGGKHLEKQAVRYPCITNAEITENRLKRMGPRGFEPRLRAPKARRIPSYPTVPHLEMSDSDA